MSKIERGVVLSPHVYRDPIGTQLFVEDFDQHELRKYLTYWDMIELPITGFRHIDSHDIDFLERCKALQRTPCAIDLSHHLMLEDLGDNILPPEFITIFADAQDAMFEKLNEKEPAAWSKGHQSEILPRAGEGSYKRYVEIDLHGVVPVPSEDTSLEDILNFKQKRADELLAFRAHTDEIYQKIITSPDEARSLQIEKTKLEAK